MQIQEKVQNRDQRMTRENLILAKAIGTLYSLGYDKGAIAEIVTKTKEPETDTVSYLRDRLTVIRGEYSSAPESYEAIRKLIGDCDDALAKRSQTEKL